MATAAVSAYKLVQAQEKLKTDTIFQEADNERIKDRMQALKDIAGSEKATQQARTNALTELAKLNKDYADKNEILQDLALANAIKRNNTSNKLRNNDILNLKTNGTLAAAELLKNGKIDEKQFNDLKKVFDDRKTLRQDETEHQKAYLDGMQQIEDANAAKNKQ
ncbi:hypothetical protein [Mucilaginibacter gilvus]|uniref:Uncharacterized protein n=1 Tax=Mucilaginibacter gilvus TaxID=2305909 RepID=A0A444MNB8_9SPHI|nr:hypothetical protein [Mucilaginibacter gilvus]RWY51193.1 hypothetical protein EPL05_14100 [Mucilaginibacter gilvus]